MILLAYWGERGDITEIQELEHTYGRALREQEEHSYTCTVAYEYLANGV